MDLDITGTTAAEIADSVRALRERGMLRPGDALPPVRELAATLGVNRNTAVAAYRQLAQAGLVISKGRGGTLLTGGGHLAQEGVAANTVLQDIGSGNPDASLIPDPSAALSRIVGRPVLYGEPVIDPGLEEWAREWLLTDLPREDLHITVTSGAVDAVERLLAQALTRDDAVALEDPCFLASLHTMHLGGYRGVPVPVDAEGMTVQGLQAALDAGVRAIISTPRAQNPTGVSLTPTRAAELREVLRRHPYVLIIEDDHFSLLSTHSYASLIGPEHRRYALLRSVSKFLGPDMCLAIAGTDPTTAERLGMRLNPGTTWVSHLLQRLAHAQLADPAIRKAIAAAGSHYADRNSTFISELASRGIVTHSSDGLSLWVRLPVPARDAAERLMRRGWLVRTGDEFSIDDASAASDHLRLTVHDLSDADTARLLDDLEAAALIRTPAGERMSG